MLVQLCEYTKKEKNHWIVYIWKKKNLKKTRTWTTVWCRSRKAPHSGKEPCTEGWRAHSRACKGPWLIHSFTQKASGVFTETTGISLVKDLPSNAGDVGSVPGWETKIPHAEGKLSHCLPQPESLCTATKTRCSQKKKKITEMKQTQWLTAHT